MTEGQSPKRRGRPPKAEEDRKDANLTFRTRGGLRDKLAVAAKPFSRSLSEEVEYRVERSFDYENIDAAINEAFLRYMRIFFGEYNNPLAMAIMAASWQRAIDTAERRLNTKKPWFEDPIKQQHMIETLQRGAKAAVIEAARSERERVEESRVRRREYIYARRGMKKTHRSRGIDGTA